MHLRKPVVAMLGLVGIYGGATMAAADREVSLNIEPQPLETALSEFARQSGLQVLFVPDQKLHESRAPQLSGDFPVHVGLQTLLAESGLRYEFVNSRTVAIRSENAIRAEDDPTPPADEVQAGGGLSVSHGDGDQKKTSGADVRRSPSAAIPEVLVSGSRSLNADIERSPDDIQPYTVINRQTIERSGALNVSELLRKNLSSSNPYSAHSLQGTDTGDTTNIDLRGMGSAQTLILVDGRPAGSYSYNGTMGQPDLNSIPLSAIERIEVLPVSASGIYGGRATGGVVNVVLRHDFTGLDSSLTYNNSFESNSAASRADVAGGFSLNDGRTSVMVSGSYADSNPLEAKDRDFFARGRAAILQTNPGAIFSSSTPPLGRTTNIRSQNGSSLVLKSGATLGSPIAYVPEGYAGASTDGGAAFLGTAGKYNLELADTAQGAAGGNSYLTTASTVKAARVSVRHDFTSSFSGFLEVTASSNDGRFALNSLNTRFTIPRTAANNPFNQNVTVSTPGIGGDDLQRTSLDDRKGVVGAIYRLPTIGWQFGLDIGWERTELENSVPSIGISAAGSAAVTSGSIDVFKDTNAFPVNLGTYVVPATQVLPVDSTLRTITLRGGGRLFRLPGGDITTSLQVENRKDSLDAFSFLLPADNAEGFYPARSQTINSVVAELRIPMVSSENSRSWLKLLEFQAAGRFDDYKLESATDQFFFEGVPDVAQEHAEDHFSSVVPTFGVRVSPVSDVMFRGSYAKGFRPPELNQLVPGADLPVPTGLPLVFDPRRGNTPIAYPINTLTGGSPDLEPETSVTKSFGFVLTPRFLSGLRVSWDWVKINKHKNIAVIGLGQAALDNELLVPGLILRAPAQNDGYDVGPIVAINNRYLNVNRSLFEGYDWALDYQPSADRYGKFDFSASASQNIHSESQVTPTSAVQERATTLSLPRWSARASAAWTLRSLTLSWSTQYLDSFWLFANHSIAPNAASATIPSAIYHDFAVIYRVKPSTFPGWTSPFSATEWNFGINNVFNRPPRAMLDLGGNLYDIRADPRLRTYYVSVRKSFF